MPAELQQQVIGIVDQTRRRSGWPARRTLRRLGVSPTSYYRWRCSSTKRCPRSDKQCANMP